MPELELAAADGGAARRAFFDLPYRLYAQEKFWVPPLRSEEKKTLSGRHPFFRHADFQLYVARRGGEAVGRIAAILDRDAPSEAGVRIGSFGYFESVRDPEAAAGLVSAARAWLRSRGAGRLRGPLNPSLNYACGVLVDGFDDYPAIAMPYNPPYYDALLTGAGLSKAKDLLALHLDLEQLRDRRAQRFAQLAGDAVRLRPIDPGRQEEEARLIWSLYSKSWRANWGFAPASLDEFRAIGADLLRFAEPKLIQFCEVNGEPVGLACILPDLNQALRRSGGRLLPFGWWHIVRIRKTATRARIFILGVLPEWQGTGVAAAFLRLARLPEAGRYRDVEASWILEENRAARRGLEFVGARVYKRYRLYEG